MCAFEPEGLNGRPLFSLHTMLRIYFMQQCFALSDPAMEEALFDIPLYREFAQLGTQVRLPDESTILRFSTGWRNTSWPIKSCPRLTLCWSKKDCCSKRALLSMPR